MSTRFRFLVVACGVVLFTSTAAAQAPTSSPDSLRIDNRSTSVVAAGPTLAEESAAFRAPTRTEITTGNRQGAGVERAALNRGQKLMIVGGAAILAGGIIGDDPGQAIMVGGAVIFIIGVWEYLK